MNYTDLNRLAQHLQRPLADEEAARAPAVIAAASRWIDRRTNNRYGVTSVTGEQHTLDGVHIYLRRRPVSAVSLVTIRANFVTSLVTTLTAGRDYELIDPERGELFIGPGPDVITTDPLLGTWPSAWLGWLLMVDYTVGELVPPDVQLAADILTARWLLDPESWQLQSESIGGVTATYKQDGGVPAEVLALLPKRVVFA